jgi:hypothetical protein
MPRRRPTGRRPACCRATGQGDSGGEGVTRNKHYLGDKPDSWDQLQPVCPAGRHQGDLSRPDAGRHARPRSGRGGFGFNWNPVAGDYSVDVIVTGEMWGTRWKYAMACPRGGREELKWPDRFSAANRCNAIARSASRAIPCGAPRRQLRAAITQRLSSEHADLLAIPEVDPSGRRIDWYAPFDGEVRRLAISATPSASRSRTRSVACMTGLVGLAVSMEEPTRSGAERNFARLPAPCADRARRGDALRRRRQAGDDLLGLLPMPPAGSFLPRAAVPVPALPARRAGAPGRLRRRRDGATGCARHLVAMAAAALLSVLLAGLAWCCALSAASRARLEAKRATRACLLGAPAVELQNVRLATLQQDNETCARTGAADDDCRAARAAMRAGVWCPAVSVVAQWRADRARRRPMTKAPGVNVAAKARERPTARPPRADGKDQPKARMQGPTQGAT